MPVKTKLQPLSTEEYLDGERHSDIRHEFIGGQTYAMVGASNYHNLIATTLIRLLGNHLTGSPCRVFTGDMKVRVGEDFYYPDLMVCCHLPPGLYYYVTEPLVVVEILSPGTEARDRVEKRLAYQRLPSLDEYVLIAQDKVQGEVYRRIEDGWELERFGERDTLRLESLDLTLPLTEIYRDVMSAP